MDMNTDPMMGEMGEAEKVKCVHIYLKDDGTALVSMGEEPLPTEGEEAASTDEAFELARQMIENPEQDDEGDLAAAQAGYAKKAPPTMNAPSPEGLFGE